jgi:hypothetical protein
MWRMVRLVEGSRRAVTIAITSPPSTACRGQQTPTCAVDQLTNKDRARAPFLTPCPEIVCLARLRGKGRREGGAHDASTNKGASSGRGRERLLRPAAHSPTQRANDRWARGGYPPPLAQQPKKKAKLGRGGGEGSGGGEDRCHPPHVDAPAHTSRCASRRASPTASCMRSALQLPAMRQPGSSRISYAPSTTTPRRKTTVGTHSTP